MDKVKKLRTPVRISIARTLNAINAELLSEQPNLEFLENSKEKLEELRQQVCNFDEKLLDAMVDKGETEENISIESVAAEEYTDNIRISLRKIVKVINSAIQVDIPEQDNMSVANTYVSNNTRKTYKLPKLEIKKFNSELINWLTFWGQFEKTHNDPEINDADKCHYLFQSMEEGTRAYELVSGYPQSAANYPKMVQALRDQFGREKLLKQVYVRELLKMVINNAKDGNKIALSKMFDKLESHLRSLESLGITTEQTAEFLYPMVESCLPEDVLIAWQRSANYGKDGSQDDPPMTEMDYLIQFLQREVQSEEQRTLARSGFVTDSENKREKKPKTGSHAKGCSTAFGLFAMGCLFCSKKHASQDCIRAMNMTLAERNQIIKEKNHCFSCLKPHHTAKNCKTPVRCVVCGRRHYGLMCNEVKSKDKEVKENSDKEITTEFKTDTVQSVLASQLCSSKILLMTCLVSIKGLNGKTRTCRVLFDSGSHLTRIKGSVVQALDITPSGERRLRTAVYDGKINSANHRLFKFEIQSLDRKVKRYIEAYDDEVLCGVDFPNVPEGPWLKELRDKGIKLTDLESDYTNIDLIIGYQYFYIMLTGRRMETSYGYIAIETIFGWSLSGALKEADGSDQNMAMLVFSTALNEADITQLWRLDTIGICNPVERESKIERDTRIERNLISTLKRNSDGRYVVRLPWKEEGIMPPDNKEVAKGRLRNITSKLRKSEQLSLYDDVIREWIREGFIELE